MVAQILVGPRTLRDSRNKANPDQGRKKRLPLHEMYINPHASGEVIRK